MGERAGAVDICTLFVMAEAEVVSVNVCALFATMEAGSGVGEGKLNMAFAASCGKAFHALLWVVRGRARVGF